MKEVDISASRFTEISLPLPWSAGIEDACATKLAGAETS